MIQCRSIAPLRFSGRAVTSIYQPQLPNSRIGTDAAGMIEAVGANVSGFQIGDRVPTLPGFNVSTQVTHSETAIVPARCALKYPAQPRQSRFDCGALLDRVGWLERSRREGGG